MEQNVQKGVANIIVELRDGKITVKHGTTKTLLPDWNVDGQVAEGTWTKMLEAIKTIVELNQYKS